MTCRMLVGLQVRFRITPLDSCDAPASSPAAEASHRIAIAARTGFGSDAPGVGRLKIETIRNLMPGAGIESAWHVLDLKA